MSSNLKILDDVEKHFKDPETLVEELLDMILDDYVAREMPYIQVNGVKVDSYDMIKEACITYLEDRL